MADFNVAECTERITSYHQLADLLKISETELLKQVVFITSSASVQANPLESLFWCVQEQIYCNLTGQLVSLGEGEDTLMWLERLLDGEAGQKLLEIFALGEPFNLQLLESLNRQAKAFLDACMEMPTGRMVSVQFKASVLLNTQEYRLLLTQGGDKAESKPTVKVRSVEELHKFYAENQSMKAEELENLVFADDACFAALWNCCKRPALPLTASSNPEAEAFVASLKSVRVPHQKYHQFRDLLTKLSSSETGSDTLLPNLTEFLQSSVACAELPSELAFVNQCLHERLSSGECGFVLTTLEAAIEHLSQQSKATSNASTLTTPITSLIYSSFSAVTSRFQRPLKPATEVTHKPASELDSFRERMMACNSAADLSVRDLNPLLEDYKNLLYMLMRE